MCITPYKRIKPEKQGKSPYFYNPQSGYKQATAQLVHNSACICAVCVRGAVRRGAADCALAPLACAPPLARCRYMPFLARRKRRRLHRLDEPFRCSAQPWRGVMSRFLACANCHVIRGLAHQGAQCAPCQKAERAKDVAWRLGDARNVAAAFHRARPLIANGDHVPTAYSPAR